MYFVLSTIVLFSCESFKPVYPGSLENSCIDLDPIKSTALDGIYSNKASKLPNGYQPPTFWEILTNKIEPAPRSRNRTARNGSWGCLVSKTSLYSKLRQGYSVLNMIAAIQLGLSDGLNYFYRRCKKQWKLK
jgi:hypothetical protein